MRASLLIFLPLIAGCAPAPIDSATSEHVIASVTGTVSEPDWRLGLDAFASQTGGAALRQSSIEHVVTRKPHGEASATTMDINGFVTHPFDVAGQAVTQPRCQTDLDDIERAWRKYCRHKLDMTDCDQSIIDSTAMPAHLKASCDPKSLKK